MSNTKVKQEKRCPDREKRSGQHGAYLDETLGLGVAMRRELLFASRDDAPFMNNKGYIFIVWRLEKQSKLILSRSDSISKLKLDLKVHGPCGPDAHAGADLQVFLIFCFKPILLSAHKLTLLIYGDNTCPPGFGNDSSKTNPSLHLPVNVH